MNKSRPVFLDLTQIYFPVTAILSILHRISGVVIFLSLPYLLWLLHLSMDAGGFQQLLQLLQNPFVKLINWGILSAFALHLVAGIRHILMDMHLGETLQGGRKGAWASLIIFVILVIFAGIWLW